MVIAYDSRANSQRFAQETALTLNSFGIRAYVFDRLSPTPELSFAVNYRQAVAGVVITASHNPKEYNGYKVYNEYGCQITGQAAEAILEKINLYQDLDQLPVLMNYDDACQQDLYHEIGSEYHMAFQKAVLQQALLQDTAAKEALKVVYTPLHGTGLIPVTAVLDKDGFTQIHVLESQREPDSAFSTVRSPNPEEKDALQLAIAYGQQIGADLVLGTDPDSDRVGIMVRNKQGEFEPVTGNQTGVLLLDYLIGAMKRAGKLPANAAALKTIVTTEMARAVAEANGLDCYDTFTGFKFMAEKMNELEGAGKNTVIFSYEESYGYMIGHYVRDKDAVTASLLLTEMAAWYYSQGMTLFDALNALFEKYGWYGEKTHNLVMPGLDGAEKMAALMKSLRETPPSEIAGVKVATYKDYSDGTARDAASGEVTKIALSGSNVLRFELCDGTHIVVRPSGTEPKIKVYILTKGADAQERDANLAKYSAWVNTLA